MRIAIPDHLLRVPPVEALTVARELGLDGVELTVGAYNAEGHPLLGGASASTLAERAAATCVAIASASASFVTRWGLIDPQVHVRQKSAGLVERLLEGCQAAAIPLLHLPCQGASEPRSRADQQLLLEVLRPMVRCAEDLGVALVLDTLEPADTCREWLTALKSPAARAVCDVGNARAAGRDVVAELQLLGETLAQVRLRDRARREPFASVPLGEGSVDFAAILETLSRRSFAGWLILEGPSGDDPRAAAKHSVGLVRSLLSRSREPSGTPTAARLAAATELSPRQIREANSASLA